MHKTLGRMLIRPVQKALISVIKIWQIKLISLILKPRAQGMGLLGGGEAVTAKVGLAFRRGGWSPRWSKQLVFHFHGIRTVGSWPQIWFPASLVPGTYWTIQVGEAGPFWAVMEQGKRLLGFPLWQLGYYRWSIFHPLAIPCRRLWPWPLTHRQEGDKGHVMWSR